jgi:exodeoxyribonuclease V gamma subunit
MLQVHRAERADRLVEALGDLLVEPGGDPMVAEVVSVPTRGIERWLSQRLSGRLGASPGRADGVCANVDFPFPGALVARALGAAAGHEGEADPWRPERSVWPLLELVDECAQEPWLRPFTAHVQESGPEQGTRRFAAVRHVADLYDRYGVHRPELLRAWARGDTAGVAADGRWQAELWRRLRDRIGTPSPAERLSDACAALADDPEMVDLPSRISLFGLTSLPASYLDVLGALAAARDVHLFLLHPSPVLWDRLAAGPARRGLARRDDASAELGGNRLLASWGRDAREMQLVLSATGDIDVDEHRPAPAPPPTLLGRIQADVRADRQPPGPPSGAGDGADLRPLLDPDDRSLQVHACHGRGRQVEVLRDAILHLLEDDAALEPRDVIVMCPDIETFAPLIHATFGGASPAPEDEEDEDADAPRGPADLRVRLADRSLRQTNPVLGVVSLLLELAGSRVTASEVLDLAGRDPVRRRFGFDDDDLRRLEEWVVGSGIRWGLDAEHRRTFGLNGLGANTWQAGLDRTLLGAAMTGNRPRLYGDVLPLDDVDSGDIELAGRLAELLARLGAALHALSGSRPVADWASAIADAAVRLTATADGDAWQAAQLRRMLDELVDEAGATGTPSLAPLGLMDVVALLGDRLKGRPTRANFRTGHLTICTLVPMRSVPHRVVCLLGLDDGVFPRVTERDGDDLILAAPQVGDRDARSEDRQLLLDALLAAEDHLVVTYTGRDERTNQARPPAVAVGELLDMVDRTVAVTGGGAARDRVVTVHPLQPFDARNFTLGAIVARRPWSYDAAGLAGARAARGPRRDPGPFLGGPLPDAGTDVVALADLERFLQHPVRAFLRLRLGIRPGDRASEVEDALPVELDALERWDLGDRLLGAAMAGEDLDACVAAERVAGHLPPGALAERAIASVRGVVGAIAGALGGFGPGRSSADVHLALDDGTVLVGTVPDVHDDVLLRVTFSKLGPGPRLATWVRVLALAVSRPERRFDGLTVGRARDGAPRDAYVTCAHIGLPPDDGERRDVARRELGVLVDLFRRGMREPLPIYRATSCAWAQSAARHRDRVARKAWTSTYRVPGEDDDDAHRMVLGGMLPFDRLLDEGARADEEGEDWDPAEPSRFGRYARRLWAGLLAHETMADS